MANAEVGSRAFPAEAFVDPDRADRRDYTKADPDAYIRAKSRVLNEIIKADALIGSSPGVADIGEQHAGQAVREWSAVLERSQEHVVAPEAVLLVTAQRFRAADEVLLRERQD